MGQAKANSPGSLGMSSTGTVSPVGKIGALVEVGEDHLVRAGRGLLAAEVEPTGLPARTMMVSGV